MRRLTTLALIAVALSFLWACRREERARAKATVEEAPALAPVVHVADPKTSFQLLRGFHSLEQNSWRWTMGKFSVILKRPPGAERNGAILTLKLVVPEPISQKLGALTLSAEIDGTQLKPEPLPEPGEYTYTREVPASALQSESATVNFALDKALGPGDVDQRELGVIVTVIGLEPK